MKKLSLILLIAAVVGKSYGQTTTLEYQPLGTLTLRMDTSLVIKTDTVKVVLLMSDTSSILKTVYYQTGYSISQIMFNGSLFGNERQHLYYLDNKFKPFPKNIVIWQVKQPHPQTTTGKLKR